jgi:Tol biopolymer transport system component
MTEKKHLHKTLKREEYQPESRQRPQSVRIKEYVSIILSVFSVTSVASPLLLCMLLVMPGCERKSSHQETPEKVKPESTETEPTKPLDINLRDTRLSVIPENYDSTSNVTFSNDGKQVFYKARKGSKEFIVIASNGKEVAGPSYYGISFLVVSPDGNRFAYGGATGKKKYLVVDNKEQKYLYHEEVAPGDFSRNGLIVCEVEDAEKKEWFIVVSDGEKEVYRSKAFPNTFRRPSFSPDGRLLVYELGERDKNRTAFIYDLGAGKIIKEIRLDYEDDIGGFMFSKDSSRVVYEVTREGRRFLFMHDLKLDEEREVELPYTVTRNFILSPNGNKIAYISNKEGKHLLVVAPWESPARGKEYGPYESIRMPIFGPDSTVAYHAVKGGKWLSVVGDRESLPYDGVGRDDFVWSPDGTRIAYAIRKGGKQSRRGVIGAKWHMVTALVGRPAEAAEGPAYDMVISPVWSADGSRLVYRTRMGTREKARRFIVIADTKTGKVIKKGSVNDEIWPPIWSTDGGKVAYGARSGRELWWRVEEPH